MRNPPQNSCLQNLNQFWVLLFCFFSLFSFFRAFAAEISYSDHCNSVVPESKPTARVPPHGGVPFFDLYSTFYWGGGDQFHDKFKQPFDTGFPNSEPYVVFRTRNVFDTSSKGTYKVEANLVFRFPGAHRRFRNYTRSRGGSRAVYYLRPTLRFLLNGFWSDQSRKLCLIGSGSWKSDESKSLKFVAAFVLDYAKRNSTLFTSLAKGSLKSLSPANSPSYFDPIEIVSFPILDDYNYTLSSTELEGGNGVPPEQSLSLPSSSLCSTFQYQSYVLDLEYASGCKSSQDCSPFKWDPAYLSLYAFQCSEKERKLRYMLSFQTNKYGWRSGTFDPNRTLIGEGSWDSTRNQLVIVACRVLNPFKSLGDVTIGDCSMRLSLGFRVVLTLKETSSVLGLVWTNKTAADPGYFKNVTLSSSDFINPGFGSGLRYEYSETEKVRELCPGNQAAKKTGEHYPKGDSYDMRFVMSAGHSKERIAWGDAATISVGDELFGQNSLVVVDSGYGEEAEVSSHSSQKMNISYKLAFSAMKSNDPFFSINSLYSNRMEISAEGVYDPVTGHLCMVGCRQLHQLNTSEKSLDCELFINFQFPPLDSKVGSFIQGSIQSRRAKDDALYFKPLNITSRSYYGVQAKQSIWRMDLETILVLISNTLLCVFVTSQIFYVRKHHEVLPFISLVMLTILTLGHMIPLVLNLEALLFKNHNQQEMVLKGEEWLELKEVSVRLVNLVVFLLLLRLLQMSWNARRENGDQNHHLWSGEKKTVFVTLLLYAVGGLITLLVEWTKNSIWGNETIIPEASSVNPPHQASIFRYLKSYGGLVLDGFLLPQILLNIFHNSRENIALSSWFYIGATLVRMFPHAYDLFRAQSYMRRQDFDGSYIYANPNADFYSIGWDLIIPSGCLLLALIIWLQQRFGGRCILPRKFRELGSYEKVPSISNELASL